jgi:sec-independent protein translocase protein TatA
MLPLAIFGLGVPELLIILAVVLLLFGGSRLAGLGKSTGRALKEFKEETKDLKGGEKGEDPEQVASAETPVPPQTYQQPQIHQAPSYEQPPATHQQPETHQLPPMHQQPAQPQIYQQQPPAQNPDGSEIRKDS